MNLRKKFTLMFILYLVVFGLINAYIMYNQVTRSLTDELIENTKKYLSEFSKDVLSYLTKGEILSLNEIINNLKNENHHIAYIYIVDFDGRIVTSTFSDGFPKALIGFNPPSNGEFSVKKFQSEYDTVYDISTPIYKSIGGEIHIGITNKHLEEKVFSIVSKILIWGSVVLIIGSISIFISLTDLTRSVMNLERAVIRLLEGDYRSRIKTITKDEIGILSQAFNKMLDKLEEEREKISKYIKKLNFLKNTYKMLVDSIQDAVMMISGDGTIIAWNKSCEKIFKVSKGEAVGKKINEILRLEEIPKNGEVEMTYEYNGETRYIRLSSLDVKNEVGKKILIARDITNDKIREEFSKKIRQYERIALVSFLVAGGVHKMNTIITRAMLTCELMLTESGERSSKNNVEKLISYLVELRHAIDEIYKYGRRGIKISRRLTDLTDLVEKSLEECKFSIGSVRVVKNYSKPLEAYVDPYAMKLVIDNLLANAIQAMPNGGELTIEMSQDDSSIQISIRDTGTGIPREDLNKIFEPFYTRRRSSGGLGLGLTISKEIVKMHGGRIFVESELGRGSVFTIRLPRGTGP